MNVHWEHIIVPLKQHVQISQEVLHVNVMMGMKEMVQLVMVIRFFCFFLFLSFFFFFFFFDTTIIIIKTKMNVHQIMEDVILKQHVQIQLVVSHVNVKMDILEMVSVVMVFIYFLFFFIFLFIYFFKKKK